MTVDNSLRRNLINSSSSNLSGETAHKDSTVASLQEKAAGKNAEELHHAASSDDDDEHASEHHLHQQTTAAAKSKFMITDILSGRRDAADVPLFLPPSEFPQNLSVRCRGAFGAADPALLHHRLMSAGAGAHQPVVEERRRRRAAAAAAAAAPVLAAAPGRTHRRTPSPRPARTQSRRQQQPRALRPQLRRGHRTRHRQWTARREFLRLLQW
jgi:hypothetical protein